MDNFSVWLERSEMELLCWRLWLLHHLPFPVVGSVRWIDIVQAGEGHGGISHVHMNFIEFRIKIIIYLNCMMAVVPWFVSDFDANCVKEWCVTVTDVAGNWGILPWGIWIFWQNAQHTLYHQKPCSQILVCQANTIRPCKLGVRAWENVTSVRLAAFAGKKI